MAGGRPKSSIVIAVVLCFTVQSHAAQQYLGKLLGKLSELHHGVSGEVYAVDARTLHIKDFTYDGEGPAAYFWAGNSRTPGSAGFKVRDENGSGSVLKRYRKRSVTITLPDGKNLNNIKWFSVWCDEFAVNFGDVKIPRNFDYPRPHKVEGLRGVHGVSSDNIVIVDAQTLLIPNLSYDGEAPDAKFWAGRGSKPSPQGIRIPDENSKVIPLRRYDRKTVVLTLPGDLTVFDIGHFGIWCEAFTVDFGHVQIPSNLNIPPSLKMLGVSPQSKLNCEVLYDDLAFEVRWAVAGDSIVLQLVAKLENNEYMSFGLSGDETRNRMIDGDVVVAWVDQETLKGYAEDYYLEAKSQCSGPRGSCPDEKLAKNTNNIRLLNAAMVNGYSIVTYQRPLKPSDELDRQIFTNQSQAAIWAIGPLNQRNEVSFHSQFTKKDLLIDFGRPAKWNCPMPESDSASQAQRQSTAAPQRKTTESVEEKDEVIETTTRRRGNNERRRGGNNREQANERRRGESSQQQQASERSSGQTEDRPTRRRNSNNNSNRQTAVTTEKARTVPTPKPVTYRNAWHIPPIQCYEPDDGVFYAQLGPTGGKRGYPAITGHVGWGISWYINGLLIPEINVVRGKTYSFVVEGGQDPEIPAKYHPFYITDDPIGGYEYKTAEERRNVTIFAGAKQGRDSTVYPSGVGRLCHWTHTGDKEADEFQSFGAFQRTLELRCDPGEPGLITWTPDANTPDTVYYQCFSHRYLGWKINVLDSCEETPAASEPELALALPDETSSYTSDNNGDLKSSSSIIYETRIKPNDLFQTTQQQTKHHHDRRPQKPDIDNPLNYQDYGFVQQSTPEIITLQPDSDKYDQLMFHVGSTAHQPNRYPSSSALFRHDFPYDVQYSASYKSENHTSTTLTPNKEEDISPAASVNTSSDLETPAKGNIFRRQPQKPVYWVNKVPHRRPVSKSRPPFMIKPIVMSMYRSPVQSPYKKSFYRIPQRKRPAIRPIPHIHQKMSRPKQPSFINPESTIIMKQQQNIKNYSAPKKTEITQINTTSTTPKVLDSVTESSQQVSVPQKIEEESTTTMRPAINTGFHPESVVIEGGFKPIVTKQFEDRISESDEITDNRDDNIGVINIAPESNQQFIETFEPIFIPSPPDSHLLHNKKQNQTKFSKRRQILKKNTPVMFIVKHVGRSAEPLDESEETEDEMAMAAERVEAYYLPPDYKKSKPVETVRQPSNIDIPPGSVVTYDGKTVSGVSLTTPILVPGNYEARSSKAAELLRLSPQFGPFRGEIPPLDTKNINVENLPQLKSEGVLNRDLNAPEPISTSGTTRLSPVQRYRRSVAIDFRNRRSAHHTPEHTAEQERQRQHEDHHGHKHEHDHEPNSAYTCLPNFRLLSMIVYSFIIKYITF